MSYVLFISENKLKQSTAINMNVDVEFLLPYVRQSQKLYIEPLLGTKLYQKLETEITAGTLTGVYKTLVEDYIADTLVNYAFYHCIPFLRFKVENGNIYSKTSETGNSLTTEESQHLRQEILNTAQYYNERAVEYLCNNSGSYPEYSTNSGADISPSKSSYYSNMNLERPLEQGTELTLADFLVGGRR